MAKQSEQSKERPAAPIAEPPAKIDPTPPQRKLSAIALELAQARLGWLLAHDQQALLHYAAAPKGAEELASELARIGAQGELAGKRHLSEGVKPSEATRLVMDQIIAPVEGESMTVSPGQQAQALDFYHRFIQAPIGRRFAPVE